MNKLVVFAVIVAIIVGAGAYLLLTQTGAPEGEENQEYPQEGEMGLPAIFSGDVRENVEALFASYNGEVPKSVFKSSLQNLSEVELQGIVPGGPSSHNLLIAYSSHDTGAVVDEGDKKIIIEHGSVPDAVIDPDGTIRLYFVDTCPLRKIWVAADTLPGDKVTIAAVVSLYNDGFVAGNNIFSEAKSTDGENFTIEPLAIKNLPEDVLLADPSVVRRENGSYRLYFLCVLASDCPSGDPASSTHHRIASAISTDATNFVYEGIRYDEGVQSGGGGLSDPEVCKTGSYYRLFLHAGGPRANNKVITSYDGGLTFTSEADLFGSHSTAGYGLRVGEIPGGYRMYFDENSTTYSATSDANGETWTMRDEPGISGRGYMAPVKIPDGSSISWKYLLYFHA